MGGVIKQVSRVRGNEKSRKNASGLTETPIIGNEGFGGSMPARGGRWR